MSRELMIDVWVPTSTVTSSIRSVADSLANRNEFNAVESQCSNLMILTFIWHSLWNVV